jgi:hypothetical protein
MIRGGESAYPSDARTQEGLGQFKSRTFKETLGDQILYHKRKIAELDAVYASLTPELETFVEALQKLG